MNHTPTPWDLQTITYSASGRGEDGPSYSHSIRANGGARLVLSIPDDQGAFEDAEYIVRVVNAHEDLLAVAQMCLTWTGTDHTAKYEALAEEFYRETRMMAPGKDSAGVDGWSYKERRAKWDEWTAERIARQRAQIIAAIAKAVE